MMRDRDGEVQREGQNGFSLKTGGCEVGLQGELLSYYEDFRQSGVAWGDGALRG